MAIGVNWDEVWADVWGDVWATSFPADTDNYVYVPYLIGKTEEAARARIAGIYCTASVTGSSGTVTAQSPAHMSFVARGTTVSITLGGSINAAPNPRRRGWSAYGGQNNTSDNPDPFSRQ